MMATTRSKRSDPSIWYTDSGASDHFSPYKELFQTFHILKEPAEIDIAEGTAIGIAKGTVRITVIEEDNKEIELELNNVIYIPNMSSNLFSLMAVYDLGYETRITPGHGLRILHNVVLVTFSTGYEPGSALEPKGPSPCRLGVIKVEVHRCRQERNLESWLRVIWPNLSPAICHHRTRADPPTE